jgi:hypothetical protein
VLDFDKPALDDVGGAQLRHRCRGRWFARSTSKASIALSTPSSSVLRGLAVQVLVSVHGADEAVRDLLDLRLTRYPLLDRGSNRSSKTDHRPMKLHYQRSSNGALPRGLFFGDLRENCIRLLL